MKSCPECTATYPNDYAICPKDGAPLHETTLWQIGTVVRGKYRILARLGEGGMATVYKAHHELLDEFRALKVIKPDMARDAEFMGRFKNEAIMCRRLTHPNAVRVDDLDIAEDGLPFIAMELVVGDTLKTLVQRTGPLPVSLVLDIALHICEALNAAHKLGLVHRDIKPENIVLVAQRAGPPTAKILDFGISRLREEFAGGEGLTRTGMVIGTPEYMSPEQALGKRSTEIDGRSDLYSLGIVMYRMLTGELPFKADTTVEMILQHLKTPPTPPHKLKPELAIPEDVSKIVMKALEKNRDKRFSTGAEMAAAIKKARGSPTLSSLKVDWSELSSAAATFGAEIDGSGSPPPRAVPPAAPRAAPRPVSGVPPAPATAVADKPVYRTSARIAPHLPPHREFPTRLVLTVVGVVVLLGSGFAVWRHVKSRSPAAQTTTPTSAPATPNPLKVDSAGSPKIGAASSAETPAPNQPKELSFEEKAKVVEMNSMADIYYREGGCAKALSIYQQVLVIDPHNTKAYRAVEKCYGQLKNEQRVVIPRLSTPTGSSPNR